MSVALGILPYFFMGGGCQCLHEPVLDSLVFSASWGLVEGGIVTGVWVSIPAMLSPTSPAPNLLQGRQEEEGSLM